MGVGMRKMNELLTRHLIAVLLGAVLSSIIAVLFAPELFFGLFIGGALTGGAVSVAGVVFGDGK